MAKKILVVDDSQVARHEIVEKLGAAGFATAEAENGMRALEIVRQGGIGLILTDVHMPIMNGIEMCEAVFAALADKTPPIVVVSTESNADMKARGKRAGVKAWVIKPVDVNKLLQVAGTLMKNSGEG